MHISPPICVMCKHLDREEKGFSCAAYPAGIPDRIVLSQSDHRVAQVDDNGVQFELEDDVFSEEEFAMLLRVAGLPEVPSLRMRA